MTTPSSTSTDDATSGNSCSAADAPITVYRRYDDGFEVRSMTLKDIDDIIEFYVGYGVVVCRYDLEVALKSFPASERGFYVGTMDGKVVGSFVALPWGDDILYGSYFYVHPEFRRRGFAYRIRDEVALKHVGLRTLCMDSVLGPAADSNRKKFGCDDAFLTIRYFTTALDTYGFRIPPNVRVVPVTSVDFDKIIEYDNKCFVTKDFPTRKEFLRRILALEQNTGYAALDDVTGDVIGLACRRLAAQENSYLVGPLYADSRPIAECLMARLCEEVSGKLITVNIWDADAEVQEFMKKFNLTVFSAMARHRINPPENFNEFKRQVYAVYNSQLCGF